VTPRHVPIFSTGCSSTGVWYTSFRSKLKGRRIQKYRMSINSFPDYKYLLQENYLDLLELYVAPQFEEFQLWIIFQQHGAPPQWGSDVRRFLDATFPNRWIGRDGLTPWPPRPPDITRLDFFLWGYVKNKMFSTSVPDITNLKAKNNRRFCYNDWRHVGEHVERNWLSIRRSPCNKRSKCWSVLMCYKQTSWVELHFEKIYIFVFHVVFL